MFEWITFPKVKLLNTSTTALVCNTSSVDERFPPPHRNVFQLFLQVGDGFCLDAPPRTRSTGRCYLMHGFTPLQQASVQPAALLLLHTKRGSQCSGRHAAHPCSPTCVCIGGLKGCRARSRPCCTPSSLLAPLSSLLSPLASAAQRHLHACAKLLPSPPPILLHHLSLAPTSIIGRGSSHLHLD